MNLSLPGHTLIPRVLRVAVLDCDGVIRSVNQAWRSFALSAGGEALAGRVCEGASYLEACRRAARDEPLAAAAEAGIRDCLAGRREEFALEYPCATPAGARWFLLHASATPAGGGAVTAHLDVTAERLAAEREQAALREALAKSAFDWRSTFDAIGHAIVILSPDARVQRVNQAARELLGLEYRAILDRPLSEVGSGQPWEAAADMARRLVEGLPPEPCEARAADGRRAWEVEGSVSAPADDGDRRLILQIRETTGTLALQDSLRRSETMAALGAVVGGVAHEVRNPLFGMTAVLDAFQSRFGERPEYRQYLSRLNQELARLTDLMSSLLEYGKPAHSALVDGEALDVLEEALEQARSRIDAEGVEVAIDVRCLPRIRFDRRRLGQAFQNVLVNAIQHSPPGGTVSVRLESVAVDGAPRMRLTVSDQGAGFDPADLPKLFEPFFSRREGGTGLGLSIVARVVESHGGSIRAGNAAGGGARVEIELPETAPAEEG